MQFFISHVLSQLANLYQYKKDAEEMWDIDQMKPLIATVVLSLFTPSFRRSTASSTSLMMP